MISAENMFRLARMQERIYRCIEDELREDSHHKSYEGAMDVTLSLPNIFEREKPPEWTIGLHAYVLDGMDGRHDHWSGRTIDEAIAVAEAGVNKIARGYEMRRFSRAMDAMCDDENERDGGTSYGRNKHEGDGDVSTRSPWTCQKTTASRLSGYGLMKTAFRCSRQPTALSLSPANHP